MKWKPIVIGITAAASFWGAFVEAQEGVRWEPLSLQAAQQQAAQTRRLVLIHFWSPNCGPCQKMERLVFSRPDVAAAVETYYVPVKINADQFPYTARQYGITALPTDIILSPTGQVIRRFQGAVPAEQYMAQLHRVAVEMQLAGASSQPGLDPASLSQGIPSSPASSEIPPAWPRGPAGATSYRETPPNPSPAVQNPPDWTTSRQAYQVPSYGHIGQRGVSVQNPPSTFYSGGNSHSDILGPADHFRPPPLAERTMSPPVLSSQSTSSEGNPTPPNSPVSARPSSSDIPMERGYSPASPSGASPAPHSFSSPGSSFAEKPPLLPGRGASSGTFAGGGPNGTIPPSAESVPEGWPPGLPPLGLEGYCPVELVEKHRWVLGTHPWGVIHRGRTYMCAGPEEQKKFLADPDRYAPVLAGQDVVLSVERGMNVSGRREYGVFYRGRVYLFADATTLETFRKNPRRYIEAMSGISGPETASRR